jgi:hypothetical protein
MAQRTIHLQGLRHYEPPLPPGCGLSFRVLDSQDAARIAVRVSAFRRQTRDVAMR